jgi:uncharacterized protein (DUF2336 family)
MRKKDVVLMATISSYESLKNPSRTDLKQFSELLEPLFRASSDDARREAAAVLSQCKAMPQPVALFLASQPIHIAALFLSRSPAIDDQTLMIIARTQGGAHAKAIAKREDLSPQVLDFLVGLRETTKPEARQEVKSAALPVPLPVPLTVQGFEPFGPLPPVPELPKLDYEAIQSDIDRIEREEELRQRLRFLVREQEPVRAHPPVLSPIEPTQEALLVRFARLRQPRNFLHVLSHALVVSDDLGERILLDISGTQLATTLLALRLRDHEIEFVLCQFYPHLKQPQNETTRADQLIANLDLEQCKLRVAAWQRADFYTRYPDRPDSQMPDIANDDSALSQTRRIHT